jgi:hypothetical protein
MQIGAAADAHQQVKQGIANAVASRDLHQQESRKLGENPWPDSLPPVESALQSAYGEMSDRIQSGGLGGLQASTDLSADEASMRLDYGMQFSQNMMKVADKRGVDMRAGFRQLGYTGSNLRLAQDGYARMSISQAAFGKDSTYKNPVPMRNLPDNFNAVDMDAARQILTSHQPSQPPTADLFDAVAEAAYQRRIQLKEPPGRIVHEAERASDVTQWMVDSYNQLPDRGLAEDLRKGLGL